MFDIGFWELGLIFLIALIVLGPERLPKVARTVGGWVRRARGYMTNITSELEREMDVDEMREHFRQTGRHFGQTRDKLQSGMTDLRNSVESATGQGNNQSSSPGKRDHFRRARAAKAPSKPPHEPAVEADSEAQESSESPAADNSPESKE